MKRAPVSDLLVHPLVLVGFALLALNDHVLKVVHPGVLSGKLSDVAFMLVAPLWLYVGGIWIVGDARVGPRLRHAWLALCVLGIGALFTAMQLSATGDALYRHGLGILQWPLRALGALLSGHAPAGPRPVLATPDPSDLLCLPLLLIAYRLGRRHACALASATAAAWMLLALTLTPASVRAADPDPPSTAQDSPPSATQDTPPSAAQDSQRPPGAELWDEPATKPEAALDPHKPQPRQGLFLRAHVSAGAMWLFSDANLLAGFDQPLASTTSGVGFGLGGEIGYLLSEYFGVGVYLAWAYASELRVHIGDLVATLRPGAIENFSLGGLVMLQPFPGSGFYLALTLGFGGAGASSTLPFSDSYGVGFDSRTLRGVQLSLSVGKEWHVYRRIWLGAALRITGADLADGPGTDTTLIAPAIVGTASFF